jgi:hypothetical protein
MEFLASLENSPLATWLNQSTSIWSYPLVLTLHTAGLAILVGANAAFALRALGFARGVDLRDFSKLFSLMWFGFAVNTASGILLFVKDATTRGTMNIFFFKLGLIVVAVVVMVLLKRTVYRDAASPQTTPAARVLAAASIGLWVVAIFAGRLMAYPGLEFMGFRIS